MQTKVGGLEYIDPFVTQMWPGCGLESTEALSEFSRP